MDLCSRLINALRRHCESAPGLSSWLEELRELSVPILRWLGARLDAGELTEGQVQAVLADVLELTIHSEIRPDQVDPGFVQTIPIHFVRRHTLLGLAADDGMLRLVTDFPADLTVLNHVALLLRRGYVLDLAPAAVITRAINQVYAAQESNLAGAVEEAASGSSQALDVVFNADGDLLDTAKRSPVIKLVNLLLFEAVKRLASDVHLQPLATHVQVRYRIDGVLYDHLRLPTHLQDEVISRIKVIGGMDIAEKRLAQDGRTTVTVGDRSVDLRISIIPTSHGERAVIRLLDKSARLYDLAELGMSEPDQARFAEMIRRTHGIVLVTGPTGSGKSTTLYAALRHLDAGEKNIITLEDPIEYQLSGISQVQVSHRKGMTFATGLRSVLRQDPDIIMVGEIRDQETARMAVQSALTGHLVFSTLHTNNAAGAVSRLLDLGIEPFLVASSLLASLAQRLVRRVCTHCCRRTGLRELEVRRFQLGLASTGRLVPVACGCERCADTGYLGRQGVFELLTVDEAVRELIMQRAKTSAIQQRAMDRGMRTLRQDALRKLLLGETTVEEVDRVTQQDVLDGDPLRPTEEFESVGAGSSPPADSM